MLAATGVAGMFGSPWPLLLTGTGLLGALVVVSRGRWTRQGHFGAANVVTALRVVLLGFLPWAGAWSPGALVALSVLVLATDGVDGWLARRRRLTSEFGQFFDKETDALFLLVLCVLAVMDGHLPVWIVGAGLLRYVFVVLLFVSPSPEKSEETSQWARYVYTAMIGALLASFVLPPPVHRPVVFLATAALIASFAQSFWRVLRRRPTFREP